MRWEKSEKMPGVSAFDPGIAMKNPKNCRDDTEDEAMTEW